MPICEDEAGFAGMIGVALNGVAFYGGESSTGSLDDELLTLDQGQGHSAGGSKEYHYHGEPTKFTNYSTGLLVILFTAAELNLLKPSKAE